WARQMTTIRPVPTAPELRDTPEVRDVALGPDGLSLLTAGDDGVARLWDVSTGKLRHALPLEDTAPKCDALHSRVAYSRDGRLVAATRGDRFARIWEAASGRPVGPPLAHAKSVAGLGIDPTGRVLATTSGTALRFWQIDRGVPDGEPLTLPEDGRGPEFSPDGRLVLVWGREQFQLWDVKTRTARPAVGVDFEIFHAGFSPDGRHVLAHGKHRTPEGGWGSSAAQFWETAGGKPVGARMTWATPWPGNGYLRAAFRPDGRVVVIGGQVRFWEVPTGKPLGVAGPEMYGKRPVFSPDGRFLWGADPRPSDGMSPWRRGLEVAP